MSHHHFSTKSPQLLLITSRDYERRIQHSRLRWTIRNVLGLFSGGTLGLAAMDSTSRAHRIPAMAAPATRVPVRSWVLSTEPITAETLLLGHGEVDRSVHGEETDLFGVDDIVRHSRTLPSIISQTWYPQPDSNRCYRCERAASLVAGRWGLSAVYSSRPRAC